MSLHTAGTALLGIQLPVLSIPMAGISGGALAAAVTHAGGLGFIGGEYGDQTWLTRELKAGSRPPSSCPSAASGRSATRLLAPRRA